MNQAFYDEDDSATEALFTPHQLREAGFVVDNCVKRHTRADGSTGGQCISLPDGPTLDMHFSEHNFFFCIEKPTATDLHRYPIVKLTLSQPYEPTVRQSTTRQGRFSEEQLHDWSARLGYPTFVVIKSTLKNTTQFVKTSKAETTEYICCHKST